MPGLRTAREIYPVLGLSWIPELGLRFGGVKTTPVPVPCGVGWAAVRGNCGHSDLSV